MRASTDGDAPDGVCGDGCRENEKNMEICVTELREAFAKDDMVLYI